MKTNQLKRMSHLKETKGKAIKSTDPRKKPAVQMMLRRSEGCTKATNVKEVRPGVFQANPHRFSNTGDWINQGVFELDCAECE